MFGLWVAPWAWGYGFAVIGAEMGECFVKNLGVTYEFCADMMIKVPSDMMDMATVIMRSTIDNIRANPA